MIPSKLDMEELLPCGDLSPAIACTHRNWNVRSAAYRTLINHFKTLTPSSEDWDLFKGLMGRIAAESSPPIREQALEVVFLFVKKCAKAKDTACEVVNSLLSKIPVSSRSHAKDLSTQIILQYVEIGAAEDVIDQLLKTAPDSHAGSVPTACLRIITKILSEFGPKPLDIKYIVDTLPHLQGRNDQDFRSALKSLILELYRWLGPKAFSNIGQILTPSEINEVRREFDNRKNAQLLKPSRIVGDGTKALTEDFITAMEVDLFSRLGNGFFQKLGSVDWNSRRDALVELLGFLDNSPKLQPENFTQLFNTLKKIIKEDQCVVVVGLAITCITRIAKCLHLDYGPYAVSTCRMLLEKFVEKRQHITDQLREALQVVSNTTTFESLIKTINGFIENRNPTIRFETLQLLTRLFQKSTRETLGKPEFTVLYKSLVRCLNHGQLIIRQKSLIALGVALDIAGEGVIMPHLAKVDKFTKSRIRNYKNENESFGEKYNEIKYRNVAKKEAIKYDWYASPKRDSSVVIMTAMVPWESNNNLNNRAKYDAFKSKSKLLKQKLKSKSETKMENLPHNNLSRFPRVKSSKSPNSLEITAMKSTKPNKHRSDSALLRKNEKLRSKVTYHQLHAGTVKELKKNTFIQVSEKQSENAHTILNNEKKVSEDFSVELRIMDNSRSTEKNTKNCGIVTKNPSLPNRNLSFHGFADYKFALNEKLTEEQLPKAPNLEKCIVAAQNLLENLGNDDEKLATMLVRKVTSECNTMTKTVQHSNASLNEVKSRGRFFLLPETKLKTLLRFRSSHMDMFPDYNRNSPNKFVHQSKKSAEKETQTALLGDTETESKRITKRNMTATQTPDIPVEERGTNPFRTKKFSRATQWVRRLHLEMQTQTPIVRTREAESDPITSSWTEVGWSSREMTDDWENLSERTLSKVHKSKVEEIPLNVKPILLTDAVNHKKPLRKENRSSSDLRDYTSTGTDPLETRDSKKTIEINKIRIIAKSSEACKERIEKTKSNSSISLAVKAERRKSQPEDHRVVKSSSHGTTMVNVKASMKKNVASISQYQMPVHMHEKRKSTGTETLPTSSRSSESMNIRTGNIINRSEKKLNFDSKNRFIKLKRMAHKSNDENDKLNRKVKDKSLVNKLKNEKSETSLVKSPTPINIFCRPASAKTNNQEIKNKFVKNLDDNNNDPELGCNFLPLVAKNVSSPFSDWVNRRNPEASTSSARDRPFKQKYFTKSREKFHHKASQSRRISSQFKLPDKNHTQKSTSDSTSKQGRKKRNRNRTGVCDARYLDQRTKQTILNEIMRVCDISQPTFEKMVRRQNSRPCLFTPKAILQRVNELSNGGDHRRPPSQYCCQETETKSSCSIM